MSRLSSMVRTLSPTGWAVSAIAALVVGSLVVWAVTLPARKTQEAAQSRAGQITADASAKAGKDAVEVITGGQARDEAIDAQTQENRDAILSARGASAPVDHAVGDAGRRAVCLRDAAKNLPGCKRMLGAGS